MRSITILVLSLWVTHVHAQPVDSGVVRLIVDPGHNFEFVLDHTKRSSLRTMRLPAGAHHFTVWAPGRLMVDTTLHIPVDRSVDLKLVLPVDPTYTTYMQAHERYVRKRRATRLIPTLATAACGAWALSRIGPYRKAHAQLEEDRAFYDRIYTPSGITEHKEVTIPAHKQEFKAAKTQLLVASGATLATLGVTTWLYIRSGQWERPVHDNQEGLRFQGLAWEPTPHGHTWSMHFQFWIR